MRAARLTVRPPEALPLLPDAGSVVRRLATGEILFKQGDRASAIYKIESGRLRLMRRTVDDHLIVLHTARSGEFFAEASLFSEIYHCDAVAAAPSDLRVYAKATLLAAFRTEPALSEAFMARLAHQVQELRARMELRNMELRNIRAARERVSVSLAPHRSRRANDRHRRSAPRHSGRGWADPRSSLPRTRRLGGRRSPRPDRVRHSAQ
jgi:CRP-like cAMP-binding protein